MWAIETATVTPEYIYYKLKHTYVCLVWPVPHATLLMGFIGLIASVLALHGFAGSAKKLPGKVDLAICSCFVTVSG